MLFVVVLALCAVSSLCRVLLVSLGESSAFIRHYWACVGLVYCFGVSLLLFILVFLLLLGEVVPSKC